MTKISNNCLLCLKQYWHRKDKINSKYCSRLCHNRNNAISARIDNSKMNCIVCNIEFEYYHWDRPNAKYCSRKCKGIGRQLKPITEEKNLEIIKEKFEKNIIKNEKGCWFWSGGIQSQGYGMIIDGRGKHILAHRAAYLIYNGPIEKGKFICHQCDTPNCCSPNCLFQGTSRDNVQDMINKGRGKGHFKKNGIAHNRKLSVDIVRSIRNAEYKISNRKLANKYNIDSSSILDIKHNRTYREII